jgi:5,5'-dehydrodivanillate O-demethylase
MISVEENELLTRCGPGTPMGELMRRYWQPVCAADELLKSPFRTKELTVMGEELVIYRDRSGTLGCVDKYCTHRRASLAYGVVEEHGIRCQYHGWKFDETGACIEQPFEDTTHPEDNFRDKCGIRNYKVEELCGLLFVYMGPEPAPLLPRWGPLVWENCVHDIAIANLPCNWLQCQENSLDPVHTEWLHGYAGTYFKRVTAGQEPEFFHRPNMYHEQIGFDAFKYGIIKRRYYKGSDATHASWTNGHPVLFPNILWVGTTLQYRVPMTDETCIHISLYTWRGAPGTTVPKQEVIPSRYVPLYDENGRFIVDIQFNQDYMAWYTQGAIAKRNLEKLGESDKGIILFRNQLKQQLEVMQDGGEPMNVFRTEEENSDLTDPSIPNETNHWPGGYIENTAQPRNADRVRDEQGRPWQDAFVYVPGEAGYSADGDKIRAALDSWKDFPKDRLKALHEGRERINTGA